MKPTINQLSLLVSMALFPTALLADSFTDAQNIITSAVEAEANDHLPAPVPDNYHWKGWETPFLPKNYDKVLTINAQDGGATANSALTIDSDFGGEYSGRFQFKCDATYSEGDPLSGGKLACRTNYTYHLPNHRREGTLKASLIADVTPDGMTVSAEAHPEVGIELRGENTDNISYEDFEFVNGKSTAEVSISDQRKGSILLNSSYKISGGLEPHRAFGDFTMSWDAFLDSYQFNAETNADILVDAVEVNEQGNNRYHMADNYTKWVSGLLPVDTTQKYRLSGNFKSVTEAPSFVYFGIESYDEDYNLISSVMVNRTGNDGLVTSASANSIQVAQPFSGWAQADAMELNKGIGIYYDGDTSKHPDFIIDPIKSPGVHVGYHSIGNQIVGFDDSLPADVLAEIEPGVTVIKNHQVSSSHIYIAGQYVPEEWTSFSQVLEGDDLWYNNHHSFRPGTKYVKVYVAGNWINGQNSELYFDDLILEKIVE
ncbi:hypothetical protein [Aliikangiella coralliicola]|uniref:Uncharacterized protein n=1 Tax=Aliikangiella coralliicola TaxID=2592383 RepID=A0A545U8N4_9GAMM|nr:hypothetical protein [Aliikangiella coralliicola]TQV85818.1 hypothetical protein FLL46_17995 [Aliikangiella coralliicola]